MRQRILVINSCGKKKILAHDDQPLCEDLNSVEKRAYAIKQYNHLLTPAADLYIGTQAKRVKETVNILRKKHQVDYYIISAGFGLLRDDELIPPYECTFSNKGKNEIIKMASNLGIRDRMQRLPTGYDLVYLCLGGKYLDAIGNLEFLNAKATQVVAFSNDGKIKSEQGTLVIDPNFLLEIDSNTFIKPLGNHLINKGSLLLNYALETEQKEISFTDWWRSKISGNYERTIPITNSNNQIFQNYSSLQSINKYEEDNSTMSQDLSDESRKEIEAFVKKFDSIDEFTEDLLRGLNTVNTKKSETRKEWVEKYDDRIKLAKKYHYMITELLEELNENNEDSMKVLKAHLISKIRAKQEKAGYDSALINSPRLSIVKTLVKWVENPELQNVKSEYTPRSKEQKKGKSKINSHISLDVSLDNFRESETQTELILSLRNRTSYPLQNIRLSIGPNKDYSLSIFNALGNNIAVQNDTLQISFIPASMDRDFHEEKIRIISLSAIDADESLNVYLTLDDTINRSQKEITFEFPLE
ncbi:MAG: hypothetical protein INQ03_22110 [Candidatus Heimdallarchaeota archaeon]|nr:hypothetical protein [Candidatus Heimdallarchaeota archaeon]